MTDEKKCSRPAFLQDRGLAAKPADKPAARSAEPAASSAARQATRQATSFRLASASACSEQHRHGAPANETLANKAGIQPLKRGRMFFTDDLEFSILSHAAERLFPKDETGPGAIELAVPYFIDNQLAGAYGYNVRESTVAPFFPDAPKQGAQRPLLRREVFKQGVHALNAAAQVRFKKDFPQLKAAEQDQILADCEAGKLSTQGGYTSDYFFSLLKSAVLRGLCAEPLYNGNNTMSAWCMCLMANDTLEEKAPLALSSLR